jgi:fumarate reductase flavoprotein subunit
MNGMSRRNALKSGLAAVGALAAARQSSAGAAQAVPATAGGRFDTVIVGAGCAGLACAIEAHDRGGKPVVLEKMSRPAGNAIYALGGINAVGTRYQREQGIADTKDDFYEDLMAVSLQRGDPALNRLYAERIADSTHWLADVVGVKFLKIVVLPYPRLGRTHFVDGEGITGGGMLIRKLLQAARQRNVPILFNAKVVELLTDARMRITGVRALTESGSKDFHAGGGVVIASGGFSANPEMLTKYMGGWAARLAVRGSPVVTGENIALTMPVFAKLVHMDQFHAGPIVSATHVNPAELVDSGIGIIVTLQGKRFIDESATYVAKAKLLPQLTRENRALQIVDSDSSVLKPMVAKYEEFNSPFYKAGTIADLAKAAGLPVEATVRTVDQFNDAVKSNTLRELAPPNTVKAPRPIAMPPFYAFPFEGGMTATFGGPKINTRAEVLNLEDQPIPGLYAAGNAAGGLFFDDYIAGTQLGAATVFGRIAAEQTVARAKQG